MNEQAKVGGKLKLRLSHLGSSLQKIELRVLIDKGAVMIVHVLSGWLASSYPIRRAFLQHISGRVSVESVINKRKSSCHFHGILHEGIVRLLYGCLFILPNTAVILDLKGVLINQILSLSTSEYHHYSVSREKVKHARISEIAIIILSLKFIASFEAAAFSPTTELVFPT